MDTPGQHSVSLFASSGDSFSEIIAFPYVPRTSSTTASSSVIASPAVAF